MRIQKNMNIIFWTYHIKICSNAKVEVIIAEIRFYDKEVRSAKGQAQTESKQKHAIKQKEEKNNSKWKEERYSSCKIKRKCIELPHLVKMLYVRTLINAWSVWLTPLHNLYLRIHQACPLKIQMYSFFAVLIFIIKLGVLLTLY